jgi:hypothetical protein
MPKIVSLGGSAEYKLNTNSGTNNACFGCGNYGSRGVPVYRWMSCECDTFAPKFIEVINKDNMSQCTSSAVCYNPVIKTTINARKTGGSYTNDNTYSYTNSQYLRRKCQTYDRNLPVTTKGTDVFGNCSEDTTACNGKITYKPNNAKYSTQGAVTGGERLLRLKYNTIAGDINDNSSCCRKYTGESTQNINITKKEQVCNNRGLKYRQHQTVCN